MSSLDSYWDELAREAIRDGIAEAADRDGRIDVSTARLICACIHEDPRSALARFAGTGHLNRHKVAAELDKLTPPLEHAAWIAELRSYLARPHRHPERSTF
jgi:hypothetical protein